MTAKYLIKCLQQGNFDDLHQAIQVFLKPAIDPSTYLPPDELQGYGNNSQRMLHAYHSKWDSIPENQLSEAFDTLDMCYECSKNHATDPDKSLLLLYHIITKATKKGCCTLAFPLIGRLHKDFTHLLSKNTNSSSELKSITDICNGFNITLWNAAIRLENSSANSTNSQTLIQVANMRLLSLSYFWLTQSNPSVLFQRLHVTLQKLPADKSSLIPHSVVLLGSVFNSLDAQLESDNKWSTQDFVAMVAACTTLYFKVVFSLLPSSIDDLSILEKLLMKALKSVSEKNVEKQAVELSQLSLKLFQSFVELFNTSQLSNKSKKPQNSKKKQEQLIKTISQTLKSLCQLVKSLEPENLPMLCSVRESCDVARQLQVKMAEYPSYRLVNISLHDTTLECLHKEAELLRTAKQNGPENQTELELITLLWIVEMTKKLTTLYDSIQKDECRDDAVRQSVASSHECIIWISTFGSCVKVKTSQLASHLISLGNVLSNIGRNCLQSGDHESNLEVLQAMSCSLHHVLTHSSDVTSELKHKVWRKDEMLVDALFKAGQSEAALQTIARCLLVNPTQVVAGVDTWVYFMVKLHNLEPDSPLLSRTLGGECEKLSCGKSTKAHLAARDILTREHAVWRTHKSPVLVSHLSVLDHLLSSPHSPDTACYLLAKAQILWMQRQPSARSVLEEALYLHRQPHKPGTVCLTHEDDLAQTLLWTYITSDTLQQCGDRLRTGQTMTSSDVDAFDDHCEVTEVTPGIDPLLEALELWEAILTVVGVETREKFVCVEVSLQAMVTCAVLLKLHRQMLHALRVIKVANAVSKATQNNQYQMLVTTVAMEILNSTKQPHVALSLVATMEEPLLPSNPSKKSFPDCDWLIQKCTAYLLSNKIKEATSLYEKLTKYRDILGSKLKGKQGMMLETRLQCLEYQLIGRVWSHDQEGVSGAPSSDGGLHGVVRAVRFVSGVVATMVGDGGGGSHSTGGLSVDVWSAVDLMLEALLVAGRAFVVVGDAREARCYLIQGTHLARSLQIHRRVAEFHLALAELDHCAEAWDRCRSHLLRANYSIQTHPIAQPNQNSAKPNQNTAKPNQSLAITTQKTKQKQVKNQEKVVENNLDRSNLDSSEEDDFVLNVRPVLPEVDDDSSPVVESAASPQPVKKRPTWPDHWNHDQNCQCSSCLDTHLNRLLAARLRLEAVVMVRTSDDPKTRKAALGILYKLADKLKFLEQCLDSNCVIGEGISRKGTFGDEILDIYLVLHELSLEGHGDEGRSLQAVLGAFTNGTVPEKYTTRAQLAYIQAAPMLPWLPRTDNQAPEVTSVVQKVAEEIGRQDGRFGKPEDYMTPMVKRVGKRVMGPRKESVTVDNGNSTLAKMDQSLDCVADAENLPPQTPCRSTRKPRKADTKKLAENFKLDRVKKRAVRLNLSHKAALDLLMDSDEDELKPPGSTVKRGRGSKIALKTGSPNCEVPVKALTSSKSVYDFPASPLKTKVPVRKTRASRTPGGVRMSRSRKAALADVETTRNEETEDQLVVEIEGISGADGSPEINQRLSGGELESICEDSEIFGEVYHQKYEARYLSSPEIPRPDENIVATSVASSRTNKKRNKSKPKEKLTKGESDSECVEITELTRGSRNPLREIQETGNVKTPEDSQHEPTKEKQNPRNDLVKAYKHLRFLPNVPTFRLTCQALAYLAISQLKGEEPDDCANQWEAAFYLTEAQGVTFRTSCLVNVGRKLRKLEKSLSTPEAPPGGEDEQRRLHDLQSEVKFGQSEATLREAVSSLPPDWTVVHLAVLTAVGHEARHMTLTRYTATHAPFSVITPGFSSTQGEKCLSELDDIMRLHKMSLLIQDRYEWWSKREKVNTRLQVLLDQMECGWLGAWRGLLLGQLACEQQQSQLEFVLNRLYATMPAHTSPRVKFVLELLLVSGCVLTEREVITLLHTVLPSMSDVDTLRRLVKDIRREADVLSLHNAPRKPVILILDKDIQHVPWENLPICRQHSYTRIPSLYFLTAHHKYLTSDLNSTFNNGLDPHKVYYILDPDSNLPATKDKFQSWFESETGWQGITSTAPDNQTMITAITQHDLLIYCGHGTGSKYMLGESISTQPCRAAVILMGCSSGKLLVEGKLEAHGVMLSYLLGGSPCVMGNLWDVTDRDIDRLVEKLLRSWLSNDPGSKKGLLDHLPESRQVCKLPFLIGAAPVVYGLPVKITQTPTVVEKAAS